MSSSRVGFTLLLFIMPATLVAQEPLAKERVYAWKLGVKLSKVAWVHYRGAPPDVYQGELDACRQLAEKGLKTKVVVFPAMNPDVSKREVQALNYISDIGAKPIARDLQANFGESMAGLFELAMKARLAVLLYAEGKPEDDLNKSLASGLKSAGERCGLPEKFWKPLVDAIASNASHANVKAAVEKLDENVTAELVARTKG